MMFGLPHTPLGGAIVTNMYGCLYVYPGESDPDYPPEFGASVDLGEADSGIWGELNTGSAFYDCGNYLLGHVYGQVNGVPDTKICSVRAETVQSYSAYAITADFNPVGSPTVSYELYKDNQLVASADTQTDALVL